MTRARLIFKGISTKDKDTLKLIYITYIRPLLEFCPTVISPIYKQDIEKIEKVQNFVTRRISYLSLGYTFDNRPSPDIRNQLLEIDSLRNRRVVFDMKMLNRMLFSDNHLSTAHTQFFTLAGSRTRGSPFSINAGIPKIKCREEGFAIRTAKAFNRIFSRSNFPATYSEYMAQIYRTLQ